MAINFTRLFTTLGLYCGALNETNTFRGTVNTRATTLRSNHVANAVYDPLVTDLTTIRDAEREAQNPYLASLGSSVNTSIILETKADRPLVNETFDAALAELVRQMTIASESLNACTGTVTVASVGSPAGDGAFVSSVYERTGLKADFFVPDVYLIVCDSDRSSGGTQFAETFTVTGKPADALPTDAAYPSGTGLSTTLTAIDPASNGGLIDNGGFDDWTVSNVPDEWTFGTGTLAGTHVFQKASDDPRGTAAENKSLRLLADGSVLIKVRQLVDVEAATVYIAHMRLKKVADPGTDWAVSMFLVDSTGATITGPASYSNVISSAACGSLNASWVNPVTGTFITPAVLPADGLVYLEIRFHQSGALTTAAANTADVYVDHVHLAAYEQLYAGGPVLVAFSGTTESVVGDARTATVALTSGVPSTYLIRGIDRLLGGGLATADVRIPTDDAGAETQLDSLVT